MGILEKTRALLVSRLGPRIGELSADARALKNLIMQLEKARDDIIAGIALRQRELKHLKKDKRRAGRELDIEKIEEEIAVGQIELRNVEEGSTLVRVGRALFGERPAPAPTES